MESKEQVELRTYKFYTDPGHGWMEVDFQELKDLELVDKISPYSYIKPAEQKVLLEEDCDAPLFIGTLEVLHKVVVKLDFVEIPFNGCGAVRNLPGYSHHKTLLA